MQRYSSTSGYAVIWQGISVVHNVTSPIVLWYGNIIWLVIIYQYNWQVMKSYKRVKTCKCGLFWNYFSQHLCYGTVLVAYFVLVGTILQDNFIFLRVAHFWYWSIWAYQAVIVRLDFIRRQWKTFSAPGSGTPREIWLLSISPRLVSFSHSFNARSLLSQFPADMEQ